MPLLRLNLFVRLVHKGSDDLKRIVFSARTTKNSWLHEVERDLAWMSLLLPDLTMSSTEQWIRAISVSPMFFKQKFKRAACEVGANQLEGAFDFPVQQTLGVPFVCRTCISVFPCAASRAVHESKAHNVKLVARLYVGETNVCFACHRKYATTLRDSGAPGWSATIPCDAVSLWFRRNTW